MATRSFTFKETPIPGIGTFHLPVTRNDLLLTLVAFNLIAIGLESYLAHLISGGVKPAEMIPVIFGPLSGIILFFAVYLRIWKQKVVLSTLVIMVAAGLSIGVGLLGVAFHGDRALAPEYFPGSRLRWDWLIFAPPVAAPLSFVGVGLMAIIAALEDTKPESGRLSLPGVLSFQTPLKQTQQLFWLIGLGLLAATLSAFLDHGRTDFEDVFVWIPVVTGTFGGIVTLMMAFYAQRSHADYFIFFWVMILMVIVGVVGLGLHINADLPETGREIVAERFIRGAPPLAPLLFANLGLLGIITMVGAEVKEQEKQDSPLEVKEKAVIPDLSEPSVEVVAGKSEELPPN